MASACDLGTFFMGVDRIFDYVPVFSTATNVVDLFEKALIDDGYIESLDNRYFSHIKEKPYWRCFLLLLPVIGNVIIAIFDFAKARQEKNSKRAAQDMLAKSYGVLLPQGSRDRIEALREGEIENKIQRLLEGLEIEITELNVLITAVPKDHLKPGLENYKEWEEYWDKCRRILKTLEMGTSLLQTDDLIQQQDPRVIEKKKESSLLRETLTRVRQNIYEQYVQKLSIPKLLAEARKRYLESFQETEKPPAPANKLKDLVPQLIQRCTSLKDRPSYLVIELNVLIGAIKSSPS